MSSQLPLQATPHLSHQQQDLLLTALTAQAPTGSKALCVIHHHPPAGDYGDTDAIGSTSASAQATMNGDSDHKLYISPQDAALDTFNNEDFTPDLDYLDGDNFDFDNADLGGEMIGALPGSGLDGAEGHEKRKSPDEKDDGEEMDAKRQETQDGTKGAKKPGRKPLTSEPTTKRKAQNRAAQRAFRERKEQRVKDLETKVSQLTKTSEADRQEKSLLQAQVERLQVELRESRKRLSLNNGSSAARGSPPLNAYTGPDSRSNSDSSSGNNNNFQFEFPNFGGLPMFGNQPGPQSKTNGVVHRGSITPPVTTQSPTSLGELPNGIPLQPKRESSGGSRVLSPTNGAPQNVVSQNSTNQHAFASAMPSVGYSSANNMHGFASTLPQMGDDNPFGDLFSPSLLKSAIKDGNDLFTNNRKQQPRQMTDGSNSQQNSRDSYSGGESTAGLNRVFQFNSGSSAADSASPSASSSSQWNGNGPNSSCGTSPEPTHDSPANNKSAETFCDKINPCGSFSEPTKHQGTQQQSAGNPNIGFTSNNLDYALPSSGTAFDPVLFGDYRDTQDNTFGASDFSNGFFDDALNTGAFDYGSPSNLFGILQSPQQANAALQINSQQPANAPTPSRNLMAEIEKTRDGGDDDYGLPTTQQKAKDGNGKLISCNNIWNQLQTNPEFQNGTFDLDSLCSELRAKARCSESGVMVDQNHVDAALRKLGKKDENPGFDMPQLMFEQDSWENVLRKMGGGSNVGF